MPQRLLLQRLHSKDPASDNLSFTSTHSFPSWSAGCRRSVLRSRTSLVAFFNSAWRLRRLSWPDQPMPLGPLFGRGLRSLCSLCPPLPIPYLCFLACLHARRFHANPCRPSAEASPCRAATSCCVPGRASKVKAFPEQRICL